MDIKRVSTSMIIAIAVTALLLGFSTPSADAHHSYAMYDATIYRVFTGVMVRIVPNAAPLRDALCRAERRAGTGLLQG